MISQTTKSSKLVSILKFIDDYISIHQYPPTKGEIKGGIGISNDSCTFYMRSLKALGYINYQSGMRTIVVLKDWREIV